MVVRRIGLLVAAVLVLLGPAEAGAHPYGIPPLAEISTAGDRARTSLTLALDDTVILLRASGAPAPEGEDRRVEEVVLTPEVAEYLTSRYRLSVPEGPCDAELAGGRNTGSGFRFFVDHTCPAPIGDEMTVTSELLRDVSPDYRLVVVARIGSAQRRWVVDRGETTVALDLTPPPRGEATGTPEEGPSAHQAGLTRLFSFLDTGEGFGAALVALGIAAALGALHGLTPGHGKTLVAAYLAGSDARLRHAFAVGATLTVTHTAAVIAFGVVALVAGEALVPQRVEPVLQAVAASVVIALGLWLLVRRVAALKASAVHVHAHTGAAQRAMSGRGIVAVGLAGGLVPCPEAFGLLFVALTLGKVLAGLFLLLAFSVGLAAVLVAVSITLVLSRKAIAPRLERSRVVRYLPVVSAVLVTGIGVALAVGAARGF